MAMTDRERAMKLLDEGRTGLPASITEILYDRLAEQIHDYEGVILIADILSLEIPEAVKPASQTIGDSISEHGWGGPYAPRC